ncbi:hypothetical protein [Hyphomicrobium sp.]|uniref:hypothetical protein n=1 Tax=Hyphomicrobium sp. TaxID=82 RepID=UPI000FA32C29|nr:hypothetical protein [Hyphomicrobium sp.]RUO97753.1 MAG: hypothetical protein EKK30_13485 [Hyphomicrobium sp.]
MPAKICPRADIVISRNLDRTTQRAAEMRRWLVNHFGPRDLIIEILARIAKTEICFRKMLAILRATPVVPDANSSRHAITSPDQLPAWMQRLEEWSRSESEIIDDLKLSIETQDPRADEGA